MNRQRHLSEFGDRQERDKIKLQCVFYSLSLYLALSAGGFGLGTTITVERSVLNAILITSTFLALIRMRSFGSLPLIFFTSLLFMLIQTLRSIDLAYGMEKIDGFLIGGLFVYYIGQAAISYGKRSFLQSFITAGYIILILTIVYKFQYGFLDRQVRFFINGPIVFGWMMSLMTLISIYSALTLNSPRYFLSAGLFFTAVAWTASKGPLLSIIVVSLIAFIIFGNKSKKLFLPLILIFSVSLIAEFRLLPDRIQDLYEQDFVPAERQVQSIALRQHMVENSTNMFLSNPIAGVGLGNWRYNTGPELSPYEFRYPHNLILEILTEMGLLGFFAFCLLVGYLSFKLGRLGILIFLFSFGALMFSGDMSYWRILIFFPLIFSGFERRGSWPC